MCLSLKLTSSLNCPKLRLTVINAHRNLKRQGCHKSAKLARTRERHRDVGNQPSAGEVRHKQASSHQRVPRSRYARDRSHRRQRMVRHHGRCAGARPALEDALQAARQGERERRNLLYERF